MTKYLLALVCALAGVHSAFALDRDSIGEECWEIIHSEDEVDPLQKERCLQQAYDPVDIVITPLRREEELAKVPASVSVITKEDIERRGADSVAEVLRDVPGVQITDAGQAGLKRIRIRGEESRRIAILIDGQEFADEREVGTPLLIAPEMIERIEVVRGTGSVLHGSRAIGGVVNIITKKGGYHPLQGTVSSSYDSATEGYQVFGSAYGGMDDWNYRLAGTFSEHGDRDTPDGEIDNTSFDNNSYSAYLSRYFDNHKFAFSYDDFNSSSDVYVDPAVANAPPFLDFQIDAPQRDRSKAALYYDGEDLSETVDKVHLDAYYQESDREFNTFSVLELDFGMGPFERSTDIFTDSTLDTLGVNGQVDLELSESNLLIVGFEAKGDELDQDRRRTVSIDGIFDPVETTVEEASQDSYEMFAEDTWDFADDWQARGGMRGFFIDSELESTTREGLSPNSTDDTQLVGAAGIKYLGVEDTTLWAGWSQGYVFPTLINLATGAFAGPSFVNPNPDLDPETSDSFEVGLRYARGIFNVDTAFFYTLGDDYIDHVLCSSTDTRCIQPGGSRDRVYVNIDETTSFGAEFQSSVQVENLSPYVNLTWIRRNFESEELNTYDTGIPAVSARTGVEYEEEFSGGNLRGWADLYIRADSDADELESDGEVVHNAGWATLNLAVGAAFGEKRDLKLVVDFLNLFDKRFVTAQENLPARGRSAIVRLVGDF